MMSINKEYWDNFYLNNELTNTETEFAKFVNNFITENKISGHLLDIACGNGRDSIFFNKNGIKTTGVDLSSEIRSSCFNFIKDDIFNLDLSTFDIFYMRFFIHSITENELDNILENMKSLRDRLIFIETRSTRGITNDDKSETFFKSSIGENHFRMLYSKKYLDEKLSSFKIIHSSEGRYSKFGYDDPYCLRYILSS